MQEPITLLGSMISAKKLEPTFTQWSKGIGKDVIYKALHKGNVNFKLMAIERSTSVWIAEQLRKFMESTTF